MSTAKLRLWDKGSELSMKMLELTAGSDPQFDEYLLRWDCIGSAAHARMLCKIGILSYQECDSLLESLHEILVKADSGEFHIPVEMEDAHTAIENALCEATGDAGKKIHTGRSRNDQIILAVRLFLRSKIVQIIGDLITFSEAVLDRFDEIGDVPMPGYTHLQPAMPSSIGMWLHAFIEGALELASDGFSILQRLNYNPLGSAAGFGSGLPLDREFVAKILQFDGVQRSFVHIQNGRGQLEERFLYWASEIAGLFEKFAWDIVLYSTQEFGFLALGEQLTTGSSIMPQKRNPDIAELLRARASKVRGALNEISWVRGKLPSNFHRDLQYTKEPLFRGARELSACFEMAQLIVSGFEIKRENLASAMYPELSATYEAYRKVSDGVPFRDAYGKTAKEVRDRELPLEKLGTFFDQVQRETTFGVDGARADLRTLQYNHASLIERFHKVEVDIFSQDL